MEMEIALGLFILCGCACGFWLGVFAVCYVIYRVGRPIYRRLIR